MEKQKKDKNSQIVKLRQLIKKWRSASNNPCGYFCIYSTNSSSYPPPDVPRGYLAVHVGREEMKRFIIPTTYLSCPEFIALLDKTEEEFGHHHIGLLTILCEITVFEELLHQLEGK
ncbi:hypothetical protein SUGI_0311920 [Cryptomeria japonica]|uniref:auxin-induced protein 6B-like n=1 Tax=Cryptomeria japonica TaxID=3369 RepID=UPI002408A5F5|nr:auxin-induced protein 6B-like [Cryptomeria japonica]GLJ17837.1 hypothetical protein SUGI_0311920 [Cryptomeria japonica]